MKNLVLMLLLFLFPALGYAACTTAAASGTFPATSTLTAASAANPTSATTAVNCGGGSLLSLGSDNYIIYQFTTATNLSGTQATLKKDTTTDNIPVKMCIDSGCVTELKYGASYTYNYSALSLLGIGGNSNFSIPLYFTTVTGQTVAAGTYTVQITLTATYRVCTLIGIGSLCIGLQTGTLSIPITLTYILSNDCSTIAAPALSFGSAPLVSSFSSVSQTINVTCSKGSTYTVGLSNGSYYTTTRNMASGTNRLAYEIYKGTTGTSRWGPLGTERWSSASATTPATTGTVSGFTYTAQILTSQTTPAAGSYTDSVTVDLSF
ncbi:Csu type fimbrial protein [Candidatus Pantoea multigeneris]|uniref:Spore coat protein U domain-containing protein n=1 Tax=Candidatus Pantoea multigeneris TaxID=2608357 RepID=A0ABX0R877_9GAMM|nr:spore coat protein U domain-containing protein [Pantoea multigeneris]NIF21297.1 spore coat protein U domain-containing protein [Pantoea multigeneris]